MITLDVDGKVASVNPAAEALLQRRRGGDARPAARGAGHVPSRVQLARIPRDESRLLPLRGRRRVRCQAATFMDRGFPRRFLLLDELTDELHSTEKHAYEKLIRMMSHEVNNTSGAVQSLLQSCLAYRRPAGRRRPGGLRPGARGGDPAHGATSTSSCVASPTWCACRSRGCRPSNPWEIASQVGLLFRDRCRAAGIAWREELEPDLPRVACDPVQLEQVLVNVVKNAVEAIEATRRSGRDRRCAAAGRAAAACLPCATRGPGLSPEVQAQLFTPFYTTRENGQGIGLTMVQEILLAHGFDFTLDNHPPRGARFTIVF